MTTESNDREKSKDAPQQSTKSQQSMRNPPGADRQQGAGKGRSEDARTGIGASQGQDREARERDSANGTPDLERGSDPGATESLTKDPTGAFKERP
jgi:hypothetical protein